MDEDSRYKLEFPLVYLAGPYNNPFVIGVADVLADPEHMSARPNTGDIRILDVVGMCVPPVLGPIVSLKPRCVQQLRRDR